MAGPLSDQLILRAINSGGIKIEPRIRAISDDYEDYKPEADVAYKKESPIQPASLDLRVGRIYTPTTLLLRGHERIEPEPRIDLNLSPGETASVETLEKITLSENFSAIGFPIARISSQAILVTNPGHIDPGFSGHLSFTIINMGKKIYRIREGDPIISILIFEMQSPAFADYSKRRDNVVIRKSYKELIEHLAPDFGDFTRRMSVAAQQAVSEQSHKFEGAVRDAKTQFNLGLAAIVAAAALIGAIVSYLASVSGFVDNSRFEQLENRVADVENVKQIESLASRISALEDAADATPVGGLPESNVKDE